MNIALDYDRTYNADPHLWDVFINVARDHGHTVTIVTVRNEIVDNIKDCHGHDFQSMDVPVVYTDGAAKRWSVEVQKALPKIDIWIDDKPETILNNSTATLEILKTWRDNGRI